MAAPARAARRPASAPLMLALLLLAAAPAPGAAAPPRRRALNLQSPATRHAAERVSSLRIPTLPEHLAAQGYKFEPTPRQWARLAHKLSTPGSSVKVVAFGGSVSVGYRLSTTSYPERLVEWLRASFPGVQFELTNMARRATAATFAALCLVQASERAGARALARPPPEAARRGACAVAGAGGGRASAAARASGGACAALRPPARPQATLFQPVENALLQTHSAHRHATQDTHTHTHKPLHPPTHPPRTCRRTPTWWWWSTR
jgi:hypothetical protein